MFGRGAELDPLVAEAGLDPAGDHRVENSTAHFIADAVPEITTHAHVLDGRQVATLVMNARQAIADELLGDVRDPFSAPTLQLRWCQCWTSPHFVEHRARRVGDAAGELALLVAVVCASWRVLRLLGDASHRQRFAVVVRRVAAAMLHDDGMLA